MTISLLHAYESAVVDENNPGEVGPDEWNAEHTLTQATGKLLGRTTAGTGATEEITPNSTLTLSGAALGVVNADLTKADDTNVTLTLGGTPTGAVLKATSLTLGWTGTLSPARGGTGVANNAASTLTISGNFGTTFTVTGITSLTLPTSGTLATTADLSAGYQPLDSDLTSIAALTTASFGRSLLTETSAANAFTTLKQAASESATGVVELATTTEAAAGTDTSRAITAAGLRASTRERLTAARTYYVRTDGSDSNTGLADTSGAAFLTIQKAIDVANTLDFGGYTVTVQLADGTYTAGNTLKSNVGQAGPASFVIQGNSSTPANVVVSVTSANAVYLDGPTTSAYIKNLKLVTTTAGSGFYVSNGATLYWSNIDFGACATAHIYATTGVKVAFQGSGGYTISGSSPYHIRAFIGVVIAVAGVGTVTLTGTPAFSTAFAYANRNTVISINGNTYSGAATGTRYLVADVSSIFTFGGGASYLPGNVAGTATAASYGSYT